MTVWSSHAFTVAAPHQSSISFSPCLCSVFLPSCETWAFLRFVSLYVFCFFKNQVRPRCCPTLPAMFSNDLVISLDAADLHCISLKLEWDLILLQPCRSASWKKRKMFKLNAWLVLSLIKMCSAAAFPWANHEAGVMSGCKALGEVCVFDRPFIAAQLSGRKNECSGWTPHST